MLSFRKQVKVSVFHTNDKLFTLQIGQTIGMFDRFLQRLALSNMINAKPKKKSKHPFFLFDGLVRIHCATFFEGVLF